MKKLTAYSAGNRLPLALVSVLGFAACSFLAAQTYTITELPPLPGDTASAAFAINEAGQAAGESGDYAVTWTNGVPFNLHTLTDSWGSVAFALNDSGQAAGDLFTGAFIWRNNTMERIIPPPGQYIVEAYAMNNAGTVVGTGGTTFGYRWTNGVYLSLNPLPGDHSAYPYAINNYGIVAGTSNGQAVTWAGTSPQTVPLPTGATSGIARGINDLGAVVGEFYSGGSSKPFVWSSGLGAQALPLPAGVSRGRAYALNDAGMIIGDAGDQPAIWHKNSSGSYEIKLVEPLITNATGWSSLTLYAINESGQISGDGRLNGAWRGIILTPGPSLSLGLRTDADRSGTTDFDSTGDATASGSPFYFWTNDDHDATGKELETGSADSTDDRIMTPLVVDGVEVPQTDAIRDLEDFSRLTFQLTPELKTALDAGATLALQAQGAGTIHLFSTPSSGVNETRYLTDEAFARSLVSSDTTNIAIPFETSNDGTTTWAQMDKLITPTDWTNGRLCFLWEAITPGACVLTLRLIQPDGTEVLGAPVHLSLRPVRDFFEHVRATPRDGFPPPWETNGSVPTINREVVHSQTAAPANQQNVDLVWVHGWRLKAWERQNWAEMMYKRLWHGGYKGRLHAFTWPTLSGDDSVIEGYLTFDQSEHRAWKFGASLEGYLRVLRNAHSGGRLALVAHSMGNIVTGEALRRGAPADIQIMMQAALSAGCYDTRAILEDPALLDHEGKQPTPDFDIELGYRGFLASTTIPTINYYNEVDYALQTGKFGRQVNWFDHQGDKPYDPIGIGTYKYIDSLAGFYRGQRLLREVTDIHESLAFLARSRTKAVGAQPLTGFTATGNPLGAFSNRVNLQALPYNFTRDSTEHSAQFNRAIQRRLVLFYQSIADIVSSTAAP